MSHNLSRIYLLSHMRALTSLAGHILGSHPQINGYYEMHISYEDAQSLHAQVKAYLEHDEIKPHSRYLFDKLLHNDYALALDQLNVPEIKIIFSLREPEQSIKSIVDRFARKQTNEPYASAENATGYYIRRITTLADFSQQLGPGYFYYDAEMLQSASGILLPALSRWLDLDTPLSDRYGFFSQTAKVRKSDSSESMLSGKINPRKTDYSSICLPPEQLAMAQEAYRECRRRIIEGAGDAVTVTD